MTDQHRITPSPELVQQWEEECESWNNSEVSNTFDALQCFASKSAQWGADQELEACCEWVAVESIAAATELRAARRAKPPSLKEQLLQKLEHIRDVADKYQDTQNAIDDLRETLEALPE
jgi:hypothetical protein